MQSPLLKLPIDWAAPGTELFFCHGVAGATDPCQQRAIAVFSFLPAWNLCLTSALMAQQVIHQHDRQHGFWAIGTARIPTHDRGALGDHLDFFTHPVDRTSRHGNAEVGFSAICATKLPATGCHRGCRRQRGYLKTLRRDHRDSGRRAAPPR